ncbi:MAG: IS5 family transposase [Steroidobacteraceae bacterium]
MRGQVDPQARMFSYFSPESRVPADHPLRGIKAHADQVLGELSGEIDALYAQSGRPSIPPERLLKAQLLIALYSVRSDRQFCQMLDYNILFRWFLDMSLEDSGLDQSNFSRLRERLVNEDLAQRFFDAIVRIARERDLLSSEHLTVDGTLIEAWAGAKSFKPKDGPPPPSDGHGGVDFRGRPRTNDTHASSTDPEAKSARKGKGKEAKLCFGGHALMENRHGLCVDIRVSSALESEPAAAAALLKRQARKRLKPGSLGADKGYHTKDFVGFLRRRGIRPHIAQIEGRNTPGLDARTTRHPSYWISQKKRKRVEEIFGWMKAYGGLRRTRFRGLARVQLHAHLVGAAYNLLRLSRLSPATG